jgi:hypothetical protein
MRNYGAKPFEGMMLCVLSSRIVALSANMVDGLNVMVNCGKLIICLSSTKLTVENVAM